MPEISGTSVLLKVSGNVVASQTGVTFKETTALVDVSSKDLRSSKYLAGRYAATVTLTHLYVPGDAGYNALRTAMRNGTSVTIVRRESGADLESASAFITSLSGDAPDQKPAIISAELQITGTWA